MTQILNGQFLLREAPAGNMVVVFIKTDIQPKLMNITTMIPSKRMLKRDLAIAYVPFRSGGGGGWLLLMGRGGHQKTFPLQNKICSFFSDLTHFFFLFYLFFCTYFDR